ncbi:triosephosphate isomerase [Klebsormidium nitens]|uniref:Triosephosphate isomerase n=1 Tax=Klebsormidium nitens TaxID=105231 RepID=A0A1Y1HSX2_KLENI|nr:triosephosphate isomerase [Klebsormidium nitens]|eukprot:GAQ81213.1 triosephosphate isomerase [Klebsormidium nitens]
MSFKKPEENPSCILAAKSLGPKSRSARSHGITMAGTGKFFVGGNWKANGLVGDVKRLVSELNAEQISDDVDVVVAPPFVHLPLVKDSLRPEIQVAAQNAWVGKCGAYTGEVTAEQLVDLDIPWVILGHSERRNIIGESNEFVGQKAEYALSKGLSIIACIGELLEDRQGGHTFDVVFAQLKALADHISDWEKVVVAYEPVWAIGTGVVASPEQAQEVHAGVRQWLTDNVSKDVAAKTRILYGGSVSPKNAQDLAKKEDIDGFLVGGASLKGPDFATICNSVQYKTSPAVL